MYSCQNRLTLVNEPVLVSLLFIFVSCFVLCCSEDSDSICPKLMEFYEGPVRTTRFVETKEDLFLFTMGYEGIKWQKVNEDGSLGPPEGSVLWIGQDGYLFGTIGIEEKHAVVPWEDGFRIITELHSLYVKSGKIFADDELIVPSSSEIPQELFSLRLLMVANETIYVVWSSRDSGGSDETIYGAGMGILDSKDRVVALGEPFYSGPGSGWFLNTGVLILGGRDSDTGHFWLDDPDGEHTYEIDSVGTVVSVSEHGPSDLPYFTDWTKLPSGLWAARHGMYLCFLSPLERSDIGCQLLPVDATGNALDADLYYDSNGMLWIATPSHDGVTVVRWDLQESVIAAEAFTMMTVGQCDVMLGTR